MQVNGVTPRIHTLIENVSLVGIDLRSICSELPLLQTAGLTLAVFILLFNEELATQREHTCSFPHREGVWEVLSLLLCILSQICCPLYLSTALPLIHFSCHDVNAIRPQVFSFSFIADLKKAERLLTFKLKVTNLVNKDSRTRYLNTLSQLTSSEKH